MENSPERSSTEPVEYTPNFDVIFAKSGLPLPQPALPQSPQLAINTQPPETATQHSARGPYDPQAVQYNPSPQSPMTPAPAHQPHVHNHRVSPVINDGAQWSYQQNYCPPQPQISHQQVIQPQNPQNNFQNTPFISQSIRIDHPQHMRRVTPPLRASPNVRYSQPQNYVNQAYLFHHSIPSNSSQMNYPLPQQNMPAYQSSNSNLFQSNMCQPQLQHQLGTIYDQNPQLARQLSSGSYSQPQQQFPQNIENQRTNSRPRRGRPTSTATPRCMSRSAMTPRVTTSANPSFPAATTIQSQQAIQQIQQIQQTQTPASGPTAVATVIPAQSPVIALTQVPPLPPVSVSSTTQPPIAPSSISVEIQAKPDYLNKACQADKRPTLMVNRCLSTDWNKVDAECQTDEPSCNCTKDKVDRSCSPMQFTAYKFKKTEKKRFKPRETENSDTPSDEDEINVIDDS